VLVIYFVLELLICCIVVTDYLFSSFFLFDILTIVSLAVQFVQLSDHISSSYVLLNLIHRIPLLKSSRLAQTSGRFGRLASFRFGKVMVWTRHATSSANQQSSANNDNTHGLVGQFGRKGYEDDRALYLYIRQNFMAAFMEVIS
jgi:hypothetical protein